MRKDVDINVKHVTRVEGHGNIRVNYSDGTLKELKWEVPESPRFFEAMLLGRHYNEAAHITSRICGICSPGHSIASLIATEKAFGVNLSRQTMLLRKLLCHGATVQSHMLHLCFLVLPDLMGVESVIPLAKTHPEVVETALRMKKLGNDIADLIGGRAVHPITLTVGGFTYLPPVSEIEKLKGKIEKAYDDVATISKLVMSLKGKISSFERNTEYISLCSSKEYPWIEGDVRSSLAGVFKTDDYMKLTNEYIIPYSTAKWAKNRLSSYMVGALARFINSCELLSDSAKSVAADFGLKTDCKKPFMNNVAQLAETVHCMDDAIKIIDEISQAGLKEEKIDVRPKAGRGVGAVEVPRGILFHDYTYNNEGRVDKANLVIPTNQNHANIEDDMREWVPQMVKNGDGKAVITQNLETLVRAYDPCISCSTHMINVVFE